MIRESGKPSRCLPDHGKAPPEVSPKSKLSSTEADPRKDLHSTDRELVTRTTGKFGKGKATTGSVP